MKSDTFSMGTPIQNEALKALLKETKVTVARDIKQEDLYRSFGSIDCGIVKKDNALPGK